MKNIYFVGAPTKAKGIQDFNYLANNFPKYNFYWFTFRLDESISKKYKRIKFVVGLDDAELKKEVSNNMDLLVSCSHFEGFCLPIAEALLLKKPVISYRLEEVEAEFGNTVHYVDCFNKLKFIKEIQRITNSPIISSKTEYARKFIRLHYSPEVVTYRLLKIIFK